MSSPKVQESCIRPGFEMKLDRPLDFQMVADHGMYLGMLPAMTDPDSPAYNHPEAEDIRKGGGAEARRANFLGMFPYLGRRAGNRRASQYGYRARRMAGEHRGCRAA